MIKLKKIVLVLILAVSSHNVYAAFLPDKIEGRQQKFSTNKRETDREKAKRLYNYMWVIENSIRFFEKEKYNSYMERLKIDTGFHFTFKSHYEAYNVLKRCMNEGAHNLDITDDEYDQLDSIAHSPLTNASAWAAAYLLGINKNDESTNVAEILEAENESSALNLFPNPANHRLSIELGLLKDKELQQLRVFNVEGKEVNSFNYVVSNESIELEDLQNLEKGTYIVQLTFENKAYAVSFVKE